MIVSSFQSEYGIRLSKELDTMNWHEFSYLINGLGAESPLGRIVSIRAENDPETLKHFTADQKRIRNEYRRKQALQKSDKEVENFAETLKKAFIQLSK